MGIKLSKHTQLHSKEMKSTSGGDHLNVPGGYIIDEKVPPPFPIPIVIAPQLLHTTGP